MIRIAPIDLTDPFNDSKDDKKSLDHLLLAKQSCRIEIFDKPRVTCLPSQEDEVNLTFDEKPLDLNRMLSVSQRTLNPVRLSQPKTVKLKK